MATSDVQEPFSDAGFLKKKLESEKRDKEGVQKKATWSGDFVKLNAKGQQDNFYIKKSIEHPADNLSEVVTSCLLEGVIGEHAIGYDFVRSALPEDPKTDPTGLYRQQGADDYVVSVKRPGGKTLKEVAREKFPTTWFGAVGADLHTDANKDKLYNSLSSKQKAQLALVLAGCALVLERDCQYGNIIFYKNPNDTTRYLNEEDEQLHKDVGKFDNGWGLAGICLPEQNRVDIFSRRHNMRSRAGEGTGGDSFFGRGFPTNHFNDYPRIIHSQYFVKALEEVVQKSTSNLQLDTIQNIILKIRKHFAQGKVDHEKVVKEKLLQLADHLGILKILKESPEELNKFKEKTSEDMERFIIQKLSQRLNERTESLNTLKVLINMDLQYKPMNNENGKQDRQDKKSTVSYNPSEDLIVLKTHCLKILRKIQEERSSKGKKDKPISFKKIAEHLPVFNKDIKIFIQKAIKKYREDAALKPDNQLVRFYDDLLSGKTQALSLLSRESVERRSNTIILSNRTKGMSNHIPPTILSVRDHREQTNNNPGKEAQLPHDPTDEKEIVSTEIPCAASATNKLFLSLDNMAKSIVSKMDLDEESREKISYTSSHIKKDEPYVRMQIKNQGSVLLKTNGNRIQLEAKPSLVKATDLNSSVNLQIKLFATALLEAGDPTPVITKGSAAQVIALLKELRRQDQKIHPKIHSSIHFDSEQQKQVDALLMVSHQEPQIKAPLKKV